MNFVVSFESAMNENSGDRLDSTDTRGREASEDQSERIASALEQIASSIRDVEPALRRIADHLDPPKRGTVGTPYVAERLGVSVRWISEVEGPLVVGDVWTEPPQGQIRFVRSAQDTRQRI